MTRDFSLNGCGVGNLEDCGRMSLTFKGKISNPKAAVQSKCQPHGMKEERRFWGWHCGTVVKPPASGPASFIVRLVCEPWKTTRVLGPCHPVPGSWPQPRPLCQKRQSDPPQAPVNASSSSQGSRWVLLTGSGRTPLPHPSIHPSIAGSPSAPMPAQDSLEEPGDVLAAAAGPGEGRCVVQELWRHDERPFPNRLTVIAAAVMLNAKTV